MKKFQVNLAFWLLGLCNNYPYVIMLSAAHDILNHIENKNSTDLNCTKIGTGAILLADILPSFLFKLVAPGFILYINFPYKVIFVVISAIVSFIMVGFSNSYTLAIIGVVFASLSAGVGEVTFLSLTAYYSELTVSSWSSGTGGCAVLGALSYVALTSFMSSRNALFSVSCVPIIIFITYFCILPRPDIPSLGFKCSGQYKMLDNIESENEQDEEVSQDIPIWKEKLKASRMFLYLTIPLCLVYIAEYIINQTYFELLYFTKGPWTHQVQYRVYQAVYQVGVFLSRSSLYFFKFRRTWIFAILQIINVIFFQFQVLYQFTPTIWIILVLILYEGLLGGASYVNTFYIISIKSTPTFKEFNMAAGSFWDSLGILIAGLLSVPMHNLLCDHIKF